MSWLLTSFVASFLLPPLNGLLPIFLGLVLLARRPRLGRGLIVAGLMLLAALSMRVVSDSLLEPLENAYPALAQESLEKLDADAVVILGSGRYLLAPEFSGEDDLRQLALDRLRYGAYVARKSGKPILVTGGKPDGGGVPEAELMKKVLARDFQTETRWLEDRSDDTRENALYSADILLSEGVKRIALVTHAYHMPRAVAVFEAAGFEVVPAPTVYFHRRTPTRLMDFMPRYEVMRNSGLALHEAIGLVWYRLR